MKIKKKNIQSTWYNVRFITTAVFFTLYIVHSTSYIAFSQNIGINATGDLPNASAGLDVDFANKGLLIPRVTFAQRASFNPLPASAQGLTVYQTDAVEGFYYNTSTTTTPNWVYLSSIGPIGPTGANGTNGTNGAVGATGPIGATGATGADGALNAWALLGNAGTSPPTNFIGTTDPSDWVIRTNSIERMRVSSTGLVGINTAPAGAYLKISSNSSSYDGLDAFNTSGSVGSAFNAVYGQVLNVAYVGAMGYLGYHNSNNKTFGVYGLAGDLAGMFNGKVGINTVSTQITGSDLEIRNNVANPVNLLLRQTTSNTLLNSVLGNLDFGDDYNTSAQARIQIFRDAASSSSGDLPTAFTFWTMADGAAVLTERMRIDNSGNVGIGTTNPNRMGNPTDRTLTIESTSGANVEMMRIAAAGADIGSVNFDRIASANGAITGRTCITGASVNGNDATSIQFHTMAAGGTLTPRMTINDLGNVVIGTTTPNARLDVKGSGNTNASYGFGIRNSSDAYALVVRDDGNVGIGTLSPTSKLHIYGGSAFIENPNGFQSATLSTDGALELYRSPLGINPNENGYIDFKDNPADDFDFRISYTNPTQIGSNGALVFSSTTIGSGPGVTRMVIKNDNGYVGIGTIPNEKLDVAGNIYASGDIYLGTCATWLSPIVCSDIRYKKDISPITDVLPDVMKLQGIKYNWRKDEFPTMHFNDRRQIGFVAQEVEKVFPEIVNTNEEGFKNIEYAKLTPMLVEAIKEQQKMIDNLKLENNELKAQNTSLNTKFELQLSEIEKIKKQLGMESKK